MEKSSESSSAATFTCVLVLMRMKPLGRRAIGAVGLQPETPLDGVRVVLEGQRGAGGELAAVAADAVVVVQFGAADPDGNIQRAALAAAVGRDGAERAGDRVVIVLGDLIAQEVRRRVGFFLENAEVAVQLLGHCIEQHGRLPEAGWLRRGERSHADTGAPNGAKLEGSSIQDSIGLKGQHNG